MNTSIYDYFSETVARFGGKTAVIEGENSWTFSELEQEIYALAGSLLKKGLSTKSVIAVLLPKSFETIVADFAISSIGCVYMNLDAKSPAARIDQIIDVIQPSLIITNTLGKSKLAETRFVESNVLTIDESDSLSEFLPESQGKERLKTVIDSDPYCIINTSGSTGVPKGVVLNHRSFVDFVRWSEAELGVDGNEIVGSLSPAIFDIFSYELCMLAFKGSTLCLIDERLSPYPAKILEILEKNLVSFIFWVPTIMVNIANMGLLEKFSLKSLKMVWFAGEVFPTVHLNKWRNRLQNTRFVNLYGPIEITLDCTYYEIKEPLDDDQPIPIGYPCRNTSLLVLNSDGTETAEGEIGELYVRGTSLALGYYNNPEQTAKSFIQNPLNKNYPELIYKTGDLVEVVSGLYYFKGRSDTMVKHLGYRIELSDIENAILSTVSEVQNVCVIYAQQNKEIVACCELRETITLQKLRASLSLKIPGYMLPGKIEIVDKMPMNANGKIDRLHFKKLIEGKAD